MKNEAIFDYLIYDGDAYKTSNNNVSELMQRRAVYEVVRVIDGVPLFFDEHIDRLYKSAELSNVRLCLTKQTIHKLFHKLMELNNRFDYNIKILFSEDGNHYFIYFMHTFYPTATMQEQGIHTVLYDLERNNPNAKINDFELRANILSYRESLGAFEALLVNSNGFITEGSRSNVFFVDNNKVYTAPNNKVLIGITRSKVFEICQQLEIDIIERNISVKELGDFYGAFMTSTSNGILPIKSVDNINYDSGRHCLINLLSSAYSSLVTQYIQASHRINK